MWLTHLVETFTSSKLTIETLEQVMVEQVAIGVVLASLLLTLNIFRTLF